MYFFKQGQENQLRKTRVILAIASLHEKPPYVIGSGRQYFHRQLVAVVDKTLTSTAPEKLPRRLSISFHPEAQRDLC